MDKTYPQVVILSGKKPQNFPGKTWARKEKCDMGRQILLRSGSKQGYIVSGEIIMPARNESTIVAQANEHNLQTLASNASSRCL